MILKLILLKYSILKLFNIHYNSKKADFTLQTLVLIILVIISIILFSLIIGGQVTSVRELFSYE